jgi:hypothetical protein
MLGNKRINDVGRALQYLLPEGCGCYYSVRSDGTMSMDPDDPAVIITYDPPTHPMIPTSAQIKAKIAELEADEPARVVREFRDKLLKDCDWVELPSQQSKPVEWHNAWGTYRQTLRDLPTKMKTGEWTAVFDEMGLINIANWPKPPTI